MAGELRLVHCNVLDTNARLRTIYFDDLIDQKKRVTMWDYALDKLNIGGGKCVSHLGLSLLC